MPAEKFLSEGLWTTVYDSPTTNTLYRTALWLMKFWTTQGGWTALRPSRLNTMAIWGERALSAQHPAASHTAVRPLPRLRAVSALRQEDLGWGGALWRSCTIRLAVWG